MLQQEIYYDEEAQAYLLKDQCAKCGKKGHWWKQCPNQEQNFPGKPNKPKSLHRHANLIKQIEEEALARHILDKLKLIGDDKGGLYLFDRDILNMNPQVSNQ